MGTEADSKAPAKLRTTVTLDRDVVAAIERLRREADLGLSEAVNDLIRAGVAAPEEGEPFIQKTHDFGSMVDVSNIGEALEELEGPRHR